MVSVSDTFNIFCYRTDTLREKIQKRRLREDLLFSKRSVRYCPLTEAGVPSREAPEKIAPNCPKSINQLEAGALKFV